MDGWIKLHRKVQDHWIYQEKRKFSRYEAWLDMIMMANHKANKFLHGNELVEVERGQFITSELKLMDRWDWGKNKLRLYLDLLEKDGMIIKKTDRKRTAITICNYGVYHDFETENGPQADHERTDSGPSADTNKNVKKDKNEKNDKKKDIIPKIKFAEFVNLTQEEYDKLISSHGEDSVKRMIEILDNYKGANNKKYASDYRAILNWVEKRVEEEEQRGGYQGSKSLGSGQATSRQHHENGTAAKRESSSQFTVSRNDARTGTEAQDAGGVKATSKYDQFVRK
ncbi:hypothetical protein D3C72_247370 [compost metagenome]